MLLFSLHHADNPDVIALFHINKVNSRLEPAAIPAMGESERLVGAAQTGLPTTRESSVW